MSSIGKVFARSQPDRLSGRLLNNDKGRDKIAILSLSVRIMLVLIIGPTEMRLGWRRLNGRGIFVNALT
jgi:hypothetical protein